MKRGVRRVRSPIAGHAANYFLSPIHYFFFFSFGQVAAIAAKITDKCSNYDRPLDRGP